MKMVIVVEYFRNSAVNSLQRKKIRKFFNILALTCVIINESRRAGTRIQNSGDRSQKSVACLKESGKGGSHGVKIVTREFLVVTENSENA